MDKEIVVHIHDGILLLSYKKSVLMSWMNLEPIIQSDVSQKVKDKYRKRYYKTRKTVLKNLFTG